MEMSHHGGAEAESLLRTEKNAVVMPGQKRWDVNEGEKAPFLRNEPVKLTPAWEGANLPDDTLNLKGIGMELAPPKDKGSLIFLTLMLHGLGTLTAWNMFINANDYFVKYKLVNTVYANDFLPYVGWACQVPNLMFSWFNIFVKIGGDLTTRIVWSLVIEVLIFVVTVVLAMVDTTSVPDVFFWLTMISVFALNGFNAVFQNSVFGVAARLPPKYTGAVVLGSNICGTLVTLLEWLTHAVTGGNHPRTAAIYYFIIGMFVLLVCLDTYFALPLNRFFRYHETLEKRTLRVNPALAVTNPGPAAPQRVPYCTILKQSAVQLYNIFIIFFVTLTVFPAVQSAVVPVTPGLFSDNFGRVTCFLTFNLMAMFGNITANLFQYPTRKWLWLFTTARLLFIPLFLVCNYHPQGDPRTLSVLIADDYAYWFLSALLGWTSGHGSSLGMMYVSGTVAPEHAATAGMIGGACLITGIVSGITLSKFCSTIVRLEIFK